MKLRVLVLALLLGVVSFGRLTPAATAADGSGYMMIISRVSMGFDAQASIVTVQPDGKQEVKEVDFSRFSAKQMASNMTEVHKAALAVVNKYESQGWRIISIVPSDVAAGQGATVFSQTIYYLEKK
ncbi:hypothetical protein HNQ93_000398 [Hymenobacter luteus]|uniref:DUF4177 domain-containing protein n=2 Tax=Hymenobacter TaxID=89966 RepID=A0A7W9SY17_9BACT|nr:MULTISPECIES: hypothetical protein [Hymenobacter]MBB4600122.1 hypothetical protein [Hymenobacter latericoloratus]MBB6057568.1 hypothetical protein [Hymenobacter luteus]